MASTSPFQSLPSPRRPGKAYCVLQIPFHDCIRPFTHESGQLIIIDIVQPLVRWCKERDVAIAVQLERVSNHQTDEDWMYARLEFDDDKNKAFFLLGNMAQMGNMLRRDTLYET